MSTYDYRDPGTDPDYCDALAAEPIIIACAHCFGAGEIRTDADGPQDCPTCDGRGYVEVDHG